MDIIEFHNNVYNHLIDLGILFKPRVKSSNRLDNGYWFIGDDTYMNLSFWDGYDQDRKIHRIGFAIDFNLRNEVYLNISAKDNSDEARYLLNISKAVGATSQSENLITPPFSLQIDIYENNYYLQ